MDHVNLKKVCLVVEPVPPNQSFRQMRRKRRAAEFQR
jgi:hypothetical protein